MHSDPVSGMHCWHQKVRVRPALRGDRYVRARVGRTAAARGRPDPDSFAEIVDWSPAEVWGPTS